MSLYSLMEGIEKVQGSIYFHCLHMPYAAYRPHGESNKSKYSKNKKTAQRP